MLVLRILPALLLAACAGGEGPDQRAQTSLARELQGRLGGEARNCLPLRQGSGLMIVDNRTLIYRDGPTLWVNRLENSCPGMRPFDTLVVEPFTGQYCRNDRISTISAGSSVPGPTCFLGQFTPYRKPAK